MEPVAFTFRNNRFPSTHEYDFVKQIEQGVGQKKSKKKR